MYLVTEKLFSVG
jgi:hypothetical protein